METHSEIQLQSLVKSEIPSRKTFDPMPHKPITTKLLLLLIVSLIICLIHLYFQTFFLIEASTGVCVCILLYCDHYSTHGPTAKYSFGYYRSLSIGSLICYLFLITAGIGNFYFVLSLEVSSDFYLFHLGLAALDLLQLYFFRPPQMLFIFILWSLLHHLISVSLYQIVVYAILLPDISVLVYSTICVVKVVNELMESTPDCNTYYEVRNKLQNV